MEIIKKGNVPTDIWYGECSICKTIFKSDSKDLDKISNSSGGDYLSDFEYFFKTYCDFCKSENRTITFYESDSKSGLKILKRAEED